jgi:hypothetical protein
MASTSREHPWYKPDVLGALLHSDTATAAPPSGERKLRLDCAEDGFRLASFGDAQICAWAARKQRRGSGARTRIGACRARPPKGSAGHPRDRQYTGASGTRRTPPDRRSVATCAVTSTRLTCCGGAMCTTVPGSSTSNSQKFPGPPLGTSLSQVAQTTCAEVTSVSNATGCTGATCSIQNVTANSFTIVTTCTNKGVSGCSDTTMTETCTAVLQ